jgi:hypothetical protein
MRSKWVALGTGLLFGGLLAISLWDRSASAVLPPGYVSLPGTVSLNPGQVGAVGSQFTQNCVGVPQQPPAGGVVWAFVLPQAVPFDPAPTNVFDTLTVSFASGLTVNLGAALTDFGPPSNAHAYVITPTDDTLLSGSATIGRDVNAAAGRANDAQFELSHTCASQTQPTTTTTTTALTTTTTAPTTTTTASTTTTSTSTSSSAPTTVPTGSTTSTTAGVGPATSSQTTTAPASASTLPHTGGAGASGTNAALFALAVGFALVVLGRRRASGQH